MHRAVTVVRVTLWWPRVGFGCSSVRDLEAGRSVADLEAELAAEYPGARVKVAVLA